MTSSDTFTRFLTDSENDTSSNSSIEIVDLVSSSDSEEETTLIREDCYTYIKQELTEYTVPETSMVLHGKPFDYPYPVVLLHTMLSEPESLFYCIPYNWQNPLKDWGLHPIHFQSEAYESNEFQLKGSVRQFKSMLRTIYRYQFNGISEQVYQSIYQYKESLSVDMYITRPLHITPEESTSVQIRNWLRNIVFGTKESSGRLRFFVNVYFNVVFFSVVTEGEKVWVLGYINLFNEDCMVIGMKICAFVSMVAKLQNINVEKRNREDDIEENRTDKKIKVKKETFI